MSELSKSLQGKQIAVLGAGQMGATLIASLLHDGVPASKIRATVKHTARTAGAMEMSGTAVTTDNSAAVRGANIVLVCVKPAQVLKLLEEVRPHLVPDSVVISIATGVSTEQLESALPGHAVIRAMPNTACRIGKGMTALSRGKHATQEAMEIAESIFSLTGRIAEVDDALMNATTGLSASGPAFIYIILEALIDGGVRTGLSRELSTLLATQATLGAASMVLETGRHPAVLKNEVTTPGGCTIDGILEIEAGNVRATLIRAISTAAAKAAAMSPRDAVKSAKE